MRNPLATYTPCQSTNAEEDGICLAGPVCSFYGGRAVFDLLIMKLYIQIFRIIKTGCSLLICKRLAAIAAERRRVASVSIITFSIM